VIKSGKGVLRNDGDSDGDHLTATLVQGPSKGKLVLKSDGSFSYRPVKDFSGTVKFKYVATDGDDQSEITKVYITVGKSKKRGDGADVDHDVTEDQIPGAQADGWKFNDDKHSSWALPDMPFQGGMLDGLNSILANLDHMTGGFDAHNDGNLLLPDFSKLFSSDHWF
jgi:hypothetical protein